MFKSKSLKALLSKCVQVQYKIEPTPKTLTDGMVVYNHFASLSPLVSYHQQQCPVTKMRLNKIKMTFHDQNRQDEGGYGDFEDQDGHIFRYGTLVGNKTGYSDLEQRLVDTNNIEHYNLTLEFMSRNEDTITQVRDKQFADSMKVPKEGTDRERFSKAEEKASKELQGFLGLF